MHHHLAPAEMGHVALAREDDVGERWDGLDLPPVVEGGAGQAQVSVEPVGRGGSLLDAGEGVAAVSDPSEGPAGQRPIDVCARGRPDQVGPGGQASDRSITVDDVHRSSMDGLRDERAELIHSP